MGDSEKIYLSLYFAIHLSYVCMTIVLEFLWLRNHRHGEWRPCHVIALFLFVNIGYDLQK